MVTKDSFAMAAGQAREFNAPYGDLAQGATGRIGNKLAPASSIATAEDAMRSARVLANRVEQIIDRLCGHSTSKDGLSRCAQDSAVITPKLVGLRQAAEETELSISCAMVALDRLDAELN